MITIQNTQHQDELAVLGFILTRGDKPYIAGDVFSICPPKAFMHVATREIAEAAQQCAVLGSPCDVVGVVSALKESGKLKSIGGASVIGEIALDHGGNIWTESSLFDAVKSLASEWRKREAQTDIAGIVRNVQTVGVTAEQIAEDLRNAALSLEGNGGDCGQTFEEQITEYAESIENQKNAIKPLKAPWVCVNKILRGGILPGELVVLGARPSVGKSAFALNFAWSVACSGKKSVMHSLEMPRKQLFDRLVANVGGIDMGKFREGMSATERKLAVDAANSMRGKPFVVSDKTRVTVGDIRRTVRNEQRGGREVGLVVIDYLQLLTSQERNSSREREVADMSRALKLMAIELNVPVLVLAQLSRKGEDANRPPILSDLRESGAIEQDADIVVFLHQSRRAWHPDEPVRVIVAKGRSSGVGQADLIFKRRVQRFEDAPQGAFEHAVRTETTAYSTVQGDGLI